MFFYGRVKCHLPICVSRLHRRECHTASVRLPQGEINVARDEIGDEKFTRGGFFDRPIIDLRRLIVRSAAGSLTRAGEDRGQPRCDDTGPVLFGPLPAISSNPPEPSCTRAAPPKPSGNELSLTSDDDVRPRRRKRCGKKRWAPASRHRRRGRGYGTGVGAGCNRPTAARRRSYAAVKFPIAPHEGWFINSLDDGERRRRRRRRRHRRTALERDR
jgi:hypothetical protein